jgi:hypothetical protein
VKNSLITPLLIASVSRFVVPNKVDTPPTVYLYNSTSTAKVPFEAIERWVTKAHNPDGILVMLGTPESVANVAIRVLVLPATLIVVVCSVPPLALGDHCLYVGVPNAVFVLAERFI